MGGRGDDGQLEGRGLHGGAHDRGGPPLTVPARTSSPSRGCRSPAFRESTLFDCFRAADPVGAAAEVMGAMYLTFGIDALVGDGLAYLDGPVVELVRDGTVRFLPPRSVVLQVRPEGMDDDDVDACHDLAARGYRIGLVDVDPATVPRACSRWRRR